MLGCASEKLLLLLCDALEAAISDGTKKVTFTKELEAKRGDLSQICDSGMIALNAWSRRRSSLANTSRQ